jgi:hypothetical protein
MTFGEYQGGLLLVHDPNGEETMSITGTDNKTIKGYRKNTEYPT